MAAFTKIAVDWADLDLFGHVNNVAFFRYMQSVRVQFCESCGISSLNAQGKPGFMVASSQCQFRKPLRFPDTLSVALKVDWIKNSSFQVSYSFTNQASELVAEGVDVLVLFDHHVGTKIPVSEELRITLQSAV